MFDMIPPPLLPILDAEAEAVRVVLRGPDEERPPRVGVSQQQLVSLLPRHVREEPTAT